MDNKDLQTAINQITGQSELYDTFDEYYIGNHALNFASDKFKTKFFKRLQHLRDNLCKVVVKVPASRLEIIGFGSDTKAIGEAAWKIWKANKMPLKAKKIHREAYKAADAFMVIWSHPKDDNRAVFYPQEITANCAMWKDEETGETRLASKAWIDPLTKKMLITLYYPDRIEKYISKNEINEGIFFNNAEEFEERKVAGESFPLEHDLGRVPMVHFSNGESLLTDVIPLQAGMNKALADLMVGMEENSMRKRWTAGISYPIDEETGKALVPFEHDDQYITTANAEAKIGSFPDVTLADFLAVWDKFASAIARVSGIPQHYFHITKGDFPSGEAQRKAESRLIELVQESQISFGESWSEAMSIALQIENKGDGLIIEPQWKDAAPIDQAEQLQNGIMKKQLGWTNEQIQSDYGLDNKTIKKMAKEVKANATALGETLGAAFDRGEAV